MQLRCYKTYFNRRSRCTYSTYGNDEFCRWHKIIREFRQDLSRFHFMIPQTFMFAVYSLLVIVGYSFWRYSQEPAVIWLYAMFLSIGSACKYFADAIIAKDYPLSQFTLWAKLLAVGLALEIISGIVFIFHAANVPVVTEPIISLISDHPKASIYGPPLLVIIATLATGADVRLFTSRILFRKLPKLLTDMMPLIIMIIIMTSLQPAIVERIPAMSQENIKNFFESLIGSYVIVAYVIAHVTGFIIAEFINPRMRLRAFRHYPEGFKNTIAPSFPVCFGSPGFGAIVSGLILHLTGLTGAVPFVILAIIVTIPVCIIGTRWVINMELSKR